MKTKTILQTLALAMLMPAMLLTTACSNSDDEIVNTENPANTKGYALPVTINVTRQGDATTRATFDGSKLSFSEGDKLFVSGFYDEDNLYDFAGVLTWQPGDTFSGTLYLEGPFEGTAEELLNSALGANATLLPAGYGDYGFLSIEDEGTCDASLNLDNTKAFALTKAAAVEQFSDECADSYSNGFALSPERAIVCFTISGLEANKEVAVSFKCNHPYGAEYSWSIDDNVTVDATGVATFAVGMAKYENFTNYSLTVDGNAITLPADKEVAAGKIYNMSRSMPVIWNSSKVAGISINDDPEENSFESDGITVAAFGESGANFQGSNMSVGGSNSYFTFTSSVGNIKKIEINYTGDAYWDEPFDGWSLGDGTFTWEGDPATSVTLPSSGYSSIEGITSIVFTLE